MDTSKVFVRLVNVYNGGPSFDLIKGDVVTGPKIITNVAYGAASDWAEVPSPGSGVAPTNKYLLVNNATGAIFVTSVSLSFSKGRAYTIFVKGVAGNASFLPALTTYTTFY